MTGGAWLLRRLVASVAIIFAVVTFVFILIHLAPGEPCVALEGERADPERCAEIRRQFGLDQSPPVQYWRYLAALAQGNLGYSFSLRRPVWDALADSMPFTVQLAGAALLLDFLLGLALGIYQASRVNRLPAIVLGNVALFIYSLPTFWLALILLLLFAEKLGWFPVGGPNHPIFCPQGVDSLYCLANRLWHLVLPAATLGLVGAAGTARFQRAAMLEVASQDYVRTARAKGVPERQVVLRHQLRNALLSFITRFGLAFPFLLTGAVLIETIFAWPGMGRLAFNGILARDHALVTGTALIASTVVVLGNLIADILLEIADPRLRVRADVATEIVTA